MELIDQLTNNLGVNETQAKGGVGLLFKLAKDKVGSDDFSKVAAIVPDIDTMIKAAPGGGVRGKLMSIFSGKKKHWASVAAGFSKLGLEVDMISRFISIITKFAQEKGGNEAKSVLKKAFKP